MASCISILFDRRLEMNRRCLILLLLACPFAVPFVVSAQSVDGATATSAAVVPAEASQFDFLLGQWELEVHPKVSGLVAMIHGTPRLVGTWKAARTADGQGVEDEMRIVDASGNPVSLSRALRTYVKTEARWKVSGTDVTHSSTSEATGQWLGGEMRLDGRSTDAGGKLVLTRTRYTNIARDSFRMEQDRSADNGQSWDDAVITIEARRAAATATP
jgi:hypothetical protein